MAINEPVVDPNIRIPHAPSIPTPRVADVRAFTPQVVTPHLTDINALGDIARTLKSAAETGNDVAKEYAKQAGYTAVMRDDQGNLIKRGEGHGSHWKTQPSLPDIDVHCPPQANVFPNLQVLQNQTGMDQDQQFYRAGRVRGPQTMKCLDRFLQWM
jgi:hypothetical protein